MQVLALGVLPSYVSVCLTFVLLHRMSAGLAGKVNAAAAAQWHRRTHAGADLICLERSLGVSPVRTTTVLPVPRAATLLFSLLGPLVLNMVIQLLKAEH